VLSSIGAEEVQSLLNQERQKSQTLEGRVREMEVEASTSSSEIVRLTSSEKELSERCREQVGSFHVNIYMKSHSEV
jgi:hypothetical protein